MTLRCKRTCLGGTVLTHKLLMAVQNVCTVLKDTYPSSLGISFHREQEIMVPYNTFWSWWSHIHKQVPNSMYVSFFLHLVPSASSWPARGDQTRLFAARTPFLKLSPGISKNFLTREVFHPFGYDQSLLLRSERAMGVELARARQGYPCPQVIEAPQGEVDATPTLCPVQEGV